jgi:hypothetical protein
MAGTGFFKMSMKPKNSQVEDMEPIFQKLYDDLLESHRQELESLKSLGRRYGVEFEEYPGASDATPATNGEVEQPAKSERAKPGVSVSKLILQMARTRGTAFTLNEAMTVINRVSPETKRSTVQVALFYNVKAGKIQKIEAEPPARPDVTYCIA